MIFQPKTPEEFFIQFIPLFFGMWIFISLFLSFLGGWRSLGEVYRAKENIDGKKWYWKSGSTRFGVAYSSCLNIRANHEGIHIATMLPFRLGHPPLFIPWTDITIKKEKYLFFFGLTCFRFSKVPNVPFRISSRLAKKIQLAVGDVWPEK